MLAFVLILLGWIGVRSVLWASSQGKAIEPVAPSVSQDVLRPRAATQSETAKPGTDQDFPREPSRRPVIVVPLNPADEPLPGPTTAVPPRIAAGHRLLYLAGLSALPVPGEERAAGLTIGSHSYSGGALPQRRAIGSRWSADAWVMWRQGGNGFNLPGRGLPAAFPGSGAYGASQAGLVVRYRLATHDTRPATLYVRATGGLDRPRGEELSLGLALRPIPRLPLAVMGEVRAAPTRDASKLRPAAAIVTELPTAPLPLGLRGEVYGQAGWVGGRDHTPFIDGQARIDRQIGGAHGVGLNLGVGAWAGAQAGSNRIDLGPTLRLDLRAAGINARLTADYRWRIAGHAAPGSGAAITFSAGF